MTCAAPKEERRSFGARYRALVAESGVEEDAGELRKQIQRLNIEHAKELEIVKSQAEKNAEGLRQQIESLQNEHDEIDRVKEVYAKEERKKGIEWGISQAAKEINELKKQLAMLKNESKAGGEIDKLRNQIQVLQDAHADEVKQIKSQMTKKTENLQKELEVLRDEHSIEIQKIKDSTQKERKTSIEFGMSQAVIDEKIFLEADLVTLRAEEKSQEPLNAELNAAYEALERMTIESNNDKAALAREMQSRQELEAYIQSYQEQEESKRQWLEEQAHSKIKALRDERDKLNATVNDLAAKLEHKDMQAKKLDRELEKRLETSRRLLPGEEQDRSAYADEFARLDFAFQEASQQKLQLEGELMATKSAAEQSEAVFRQCQQQHHEELQRMREERQAAGEHAAQSRMLAADFEARAIEAERKHDELFEKHVEQVKMHEKVLCDLATAEQRLQQIAQQIDSMPATHRFEQEGNERLIGSIVSWSDVRVLQIFKYMITEKLAHVTPEELCKALRIGPSSHGYVDRTEVQKVMQKAKDSRNNFNMQTAFQKIDIHKTGALQANEFSATLVAKVRGFDREAADDVFRLMLLALDTSEGDAIDGAVISEQDFVRLFSTPPLG
eukprot:gnl/TRDRNA2_/TRDRNA2_39666_c0_seq1.p1 gnl/TRDRNA2_/TRDRNA2_39666_c0~~gnl/TRDRNA2_/TRDRNA2_39666_c0_seq1.p1  ORF type:complete len:636 (-),score=210.22 gnl/TRDRNA2_/TRDRNA2_39666_c0_seq1:58-1899(-)